MIIQKPQALIYASELGEAMTTRLERYARVCYKSEDKMAPGSKGGDFLKDKIAIGHESIIEHEKATVLLIIDRGISHEIVRHRIGAYSQESTRYCRYDRDKFGNEISVIEPFFWKNNEAAYKIWRKACQEAETAYMELLAMGCSAQEARSVLPNSLKTEIVVTYDMRSWRHFFQLRCDRAAHPQMRQISIPLLLYFKEKLPYLFGDISYDNRFSPADYAQVAETDILFSPLPTN
ncbi:MAG: FAD-dependent thymidylate synthase [Syntrophomonadaceae bacterium]|jgi:thymidylate synthase (FAD)|nr:FAD-dependent thymidylate synthase [Syntrophomonadaceae bacterium]